jgi:hypothetical protein
MRVGMGMIKNDYGVWHVRRKVPKALEVATARVMGVPKERVSWLKKTLGTKDEKRAKVLAKPVMMEFDRILAQAEALLVEHPVRTELTEAEIKQIADYFYAHELGADEELREEGIGSDPGFASVHRQLAEAGIEFETPFTVAEQTGAGLSDRMMHKIEEDVSIVLPAAREALARGNVNFIRYELNELLHLFRINLDPCAYRKSNPAILMVQSAQDRAADDIPGPLNAAMDRGILVQRQMSARGVVQRGLRTPTGPFVARFFIGIIPGLVAEFAFMGQSTKLVMSSSAAR